MAVAGEGAAGDFAVQQQPRFPMTAVGADAHVEFAHHAFFSFQDLQKAAIDIDQQPGDAEQGIVGARRRKNSVQRRWGDVAGRAADIQKLAHRTSLPERD
jgi:hypothetical protein